MSLATFKATLTAVIQTVIALFGWSVNAIATGFDSTIGAAVARTAFSALFTLKTLGALRTIRACIPLSACIAPLSGKSFDTAIAAIGGELTIILKAAGFTSGTRLLTAAPHISVFDNSSFTKAKIRWFTATHTTLQRRLIHQTIAIIV